jgi:cell division control protein 6
MDGAVSLCAALAAAEHGDARRALDLLRVSGEIAEREESQKIMENHVHQAEKSIERDRITEALKNLPPHSKTVLYSVYSLNKANIHSVATGDIYEVYCDISVELGLSPLTQRRLSGLINELDAIGLLNSRIVSMGRYGRTKKIRLGIGRSLLREAFSSDCRFQNIQHYVPKLAHPK